MTHRLVMHAKDAKAALELKTHLIDHVMIAPDVCRQGNHLVEALAEDPVRLIGRMIEDGITNTFTCQVAS